MLKVLPESLFHDLAEVKIIISPELIASSEAPSDMAGFSSLVFISLRLELEKCPYCPFQTIFPPTSFSSSGLIHVPCDYLIYYISLLPSSANPQTFHPPYNDFISWVTVTVFNTVSVFIFGYFHVHIDDFSSKPWPLSALNDFSINFYLPHF